MKFILLNSSFMKKAHAAHSIALKVSKAIAYIGLYSHRIPATIPTVAPKILLGRIIIPFDIASGAG